MNSPVRLFGTIEGNRPGGHGMPPAPYKGEAQVGGKVVKQ